MGFLRVRKETKDRGVRSVSFATEYRKGLTGLLLAMTLSSLAIAATPSRTPDEVDLDLEDSTPAIVQSSPCYVQLYRPLIFLNQNELRKDFIRLKVSKILEGLGKVQSAHYQVESCTHIKGKGKRIRVTACPKHHEQIDGYCYQTDT